MPTGRVPDEVCECVFRRKRVMDPYGRTWELHPVCGYCHVDMERY